jgi:threonine/homoserine/homoserine lactone efflux protein
MDRPIGATAAKGGELSFAGASPLSPLSPSGGLLIFRAWNPPPIPARWGPLVSGRLSKTAHPNARSRPHRTPRAARHRAIARGAWNGHIEQAQMPSNHSILLFMIAALALNLSPGPSILYILSRSIAQGRAAGLVSVLGLATATLTHAAAMALGLSAILLYSPLAFAVVKYLGAAYLIYLGIGALFSRGAFATAAARRAAPLSLGAVYRQGVVTDLLNPKVALFFVSFLPQFVDPVAGSPTLQILFFGLLFHVTGVPVNLVVALVGGRFATLLARRPGWARIQNWIAGTVLVGLGLRLALSEQR